jgi:outer membrane receptor protein involved in Fe transport
MGNTLPGTSARALVAGLLTFGLAVPGAAWAQDVAAEGEEAQPAAPADEEVVDEGNDIVVTATKREQTLQSIPVAVSVTTADTIERAQIRDIADLQSVVPSLRVSQSQSQFATTYSVRGFGTSGNNIGLEPSVAVFVDGVYRSRAIAQISDLPDIQRVEVLRGPQSTLFGKNASAGVISIVTREPRFDFGGSVEASYGNYNALIVKGYVTGPISETVAASLAAGYNRRDGIVKNLHNGDDLTNRNRWFTRGQIRFEPNDQLKIRLIADYDKIDEKCCAVFNLRRSAATGAVEAVGGRVNDASNPFADVVYSDVVPDSRVRNYGFSGQIDYSLGPITLTSITAYRDTQLNAAQDVDFTSARLATGANIGQASLKTFTEEFRISSDLIGPLNFILGGYYFKEKANSSDQIVYGQDFRNYVDLLIRGLTSNTQTAASIEATMGGAPNTFWQAGQGFFNNMKQDNEAYSFFGNVDYKITDRLTLTLGANYTHDAKDVSSNSLSTDLFSAVDIPGRITQLNQFFVAQTVGGLLGLTPPGTLANAAQLAFFQANFPAAYQQVVTGVSAQTAPLLGFQTLQFLPPLQNFPNAVENGKTRDSDWSYSIRLSFEATDTLNIYASYATGFKASSFNLSRDSRPSLADYTALRNAGLAVTNLRPGSRFALPEDSSVYEVGIKVNWGIASAILTAFKQTIRNFQTNTFTGSGFILGNADQQSTFGIEFEGRANPSREVTLMLAMTYLDPKYDSFVNSEFGDVSGQSIVNIHKLSATMGAEWNHELANSDRIIAHVDFNYQSPVQVAEGLLNYITTNPDGSRNYDAGRIAAAEFRREVQELNASLTYAMANGLEVSVWGRNLTDNRYITGIFDSVAQSQSVSGYLNQPRTYGVSARFKW